MEKAKTYAAIDIGSNAARLLIKRIDRNATQKSDFKKLLLLRVPLRLGFDVFKEGKLSKKKMEQVVRLLNDAVKPEVWERLSADLASLTQGMKEISIIGSGGNINKLYRLSEKKDRKRQCFTVSALQSLYEELKPLTPEERMAQYALKQDRADVIVPAAQIFLRIAEVIGATRIFVPVIGLADGIIDNLYLEGKN